MLAKLTYDDILFDFFEELKQSSHFKDIMSSALLFKYDVYVDLTHFKEILAAYFARDDLKFTDINFLNSSKTLLGYFEEMQSSLKKIHSIGIDERLDTLMRENQAHSEAAIKNLHNMTRLFFILLIASMILVYITYISGKKMSKHLEDLQQTIDNIFSSVIFMDADKKIRYVNKIFEENFGYSFKEIKGKTADILQKDNEFYPQIIKAMDEDKIWRCDEYVSERKNGELMYEQVMLSPLFDENGKKDGYVSVRFDRTKEILTARELERKDEELRSRALRDRLTGFGSYFALTQRLNEYLSGTIIYVNINNFMDFRFFYKTTTIDLILASFANTIALCIDTYKMKANIYRIQSDEFCLWYDGDDLRRDINLIRDYFVANDLYIVVDDKKELIPNIKITIGASLNQDTIQTNRLTQAMLAHHEALSSGEQVFYYTENSQIEQQYYKNQTVSRTIEYALYNDTVIVECQGIYDVSEDISRPRVKYYEVLVRLIDENGKIRYPGEFLDIAKKISLYNDITKKVIGHVFRLVERFPGVSFSMNLSNSDIANPQIRNLIEQKLKICSYPENVYFEILESEGVDDYETVNSFIRKIHSYNSKIAIDDFGSGYSNYYRILELDIDTIKIDGSIIKKLPFDKNARYLMQTISDFANRQGYNVVAEFVSSPEILDEVRKFGIKYAQGFLLGKPISPDNIKI